MIKLIRRSGNIIAALLLLSIQIRAQEWTWIKGANTINALGVYGTQGSAASTNLPGSREGSFTWTDNSGNLWLFGGNGHNASQFGTLNDLWKLDVSSHNWTWMGGSNSYDQWGTFGTQGTGSTSNIPGGRRYGVSWTDNSGSLWLRGGFGLDALGSVGSLSDLWRYNPSNGQWTWVNGSSVANQAGVYGTLGVASSTNIPGARYHSVSWKDNSGNLWLFGGYGYDVFGSLGYLNDLWKYDISGGTWTWMAGANTIDQLAIYGTQGTGSTSNIPGARYGAVSWKDGSGNFWLFGGNGYTNMSAGELNEVWKYNVSNGEWTWMKGANIPNQMAQGGITTIPSASVNPGSRRFVAVWSDNADAVYIQGGYGFSNANNVQQLNDMWKYTMSSNEWTRLRGSYPETAGSYGTQSVTAATSDPGSGYVRMSWRDNSGNLWLFGGSAYDAVSNYGVLADLWKMNPCPAPAPVNISVFAAQNPCTGSSATLSAVSNTNTVTWYSSPTGTTSLGTGSVYVTPALTSGTNTSASYTYYASATNTCGVSLARAPIVATSNSIYPTVTTGSVYTATVAIPNGFTPNSSWSPWVTNFADPVPTGGIIIGMDLVCDVVDQGWGGSGYPATMHVSDQFVGSPVLLHSPVTHTLSTTAPFPNYVYGGSNTFKMYFAGWSGWQGFINNATLTIRYQYKPSSALITCGNENYTLTAYGASSYSWTGGITNGVGFVPSVTQTYTVTGYNQYGCPNTAMQTLSVLPTPVISLPSNTVICPGQSVSSTATVTGTAHTFSWNTGSTSASILSTPTIGTKYTATAINTVSGCFHVLSRKVDVSPIPSATVALSNSVICAGESNTLAVTTSATSYALNFDGVDDFVETGATISDLGFTDFTIEAWIKTTGTMMGVVTCENGNGNWDPGERSLYIDLYGQPVFVGWGCSYIQGNIMVNDGNWHHIAVVWDYTSGTTGIGKMYVDGADLTGTSSFVVANSTGGTFKIGAPNNNGYTPEAPYYFAGSIDDVRIWNTARSAGQVLANMNSCLSGSESGLIAYYNFEDGPISTMLSDKSVNDYNGTLQNMSSASWVAGQSNCSIPFSSYAWLPGGATTQSVTVSPSVSTLYTVSVTNNLSCTGTNTIQVNVNPQPVIVPNSGAICAGKSFTIIPTGAVTYTYLNGSGVVSPATTTNYSIVGTSSLGCVSSVPGVATVTVNPLPVLSITGASAVCNSAAASQTITGADTYVWSNGATTSVVALSPTISTTYSVTGTNTLTGCISSTSKVIGINMPPVISVNSGNVCAGKVFTMMPSGAATYTFSDGSSIVSSTVMPNTNTSYYVSGTSSAGCVSTSSAVSNVVVNPAPVIIGNSGGLCIGNSYTLSASGANTYTFYNAGGTITPVVSPTTSTTYSISGTNILGCTSSAPAIVNVTVNPLPVIGVTNGTVCLGSSFTIVPTGAQTYTFSSGNIVNPTANTNYSVTGTSSAGCVAASPAVITVSTVALPVISVNSGTVCAGSVFTLSPSGAGSYTYSSGTPYVMPANNATYYITGKSAAGCVASNTAMATVSVVPVPFVTVTSGTICAGEVYSISASGASTYSYSSISSTVNPLTTTSYSVIGVSAQGCVSSNTAISSVIVKPVPYISTFGNTSICAGNSTSLIAFGANSYTWNGNLFGDIQNFSPGQTTSYTVQGTAANGCTSAATTTITVNALPIISVNSGTVCPLGNFTLVPSGAFTYSFSGGSNVVNPMITSSYSVMGVDTNGCVSQMPAVATITVINNISISVSGNTATCLGGTLGFAVTGAPGYTWSTGGTSSAIVVSPTASTVYSVVGADGTCRDTVFIPVTVYALPVLNTSASASVICAGEPAVLSVSGSDTYTWSTNQQGDSITVLPQTTSQYTVYAVNANACENSAVIVVSVNECTGVDGGQYANTLQFKVFPNPNNGRFYVELDHACSASITDLLGRNILRVELHPGKNEVILPEQAKGMYLLQLDSTQANRTTRIIKQ